MLIWLNKTDKNRVTSMKAAVDVNRLGVSIEGVNEQESQDRLNA